MHTLHFNIIEPIGRTLKVQPTLEHPKMSEGHLIPNGSREKRNFFRDENYCERAPSLQLLYSQ